MSILTQFYLDQPEPQKSCLLALRDIILAHHPQLTETRKYGMPCFIYQKKACCYLWIDKKTREPYILMVEGNQMTHPALETGDRKRMKIFRVNPETDLPVVVIGEILEEALTLY